MENYDLQLSLPLGYSQRQKILADFESLVTNGNMTVQQFCKDRRVTPQTLRNYKSSLANKEVENMTPKEREKKSHGSGERDPDKRVITRAMSEALLKYVLKN